MPAIESPTSSPPPLRVRKRTDTAGDTAAAPMPPLPLTNDEYTPDVLKERLAYAKNVLRDPVRKLTPMGIRGLKLYERACERLIDLEEGEINELGEELSEMKDEWKWTLCTFERSMQFIACMQVTRSSDAQQLQDQLVILQRTAFYARYGDVFADVCKTLKAHAEAKKVEGWQMLQKRYWTEIDANLRDEKSAHDRVLAGESAHGECPTYMALGNACRHVGLSRENMIRVIHLYSERNKTVHNGLIALIKDGLYMNLAKLLYNDCCDIPLIIPAEDASLVELLQHLIETTIDLYFDRDEDEPDNFQLWTPTRELKEYRKKLRDDALAHNAVQQSINAEITKGVRRRLRETEQQKEIQGLYREFALLGQKRTKRVASSELEAELTRVKRMKREWTKIINLVCGVRNISDTYFDNYGEMAAPPELIHDPSLDV